MTQQLIKKKVSDKEYHEYFGFDTRATGLVALHDKSLDALERILPAKDFVRIHRSHIIRWAHAEKLIIEPGGKYAMQLKNGNLLPVGRSRYKALCERLRGYKRW